MSNEIQPLNVTIDYHDYRVELAAIDHFRVKDVTPGAVLNRGEGVFVWDNGHFYKKDPNTISDKHASEGLLQAIRNHFKLK
jgi:hypothetical protein